MHSKKIRKYVSLIVFFYLHFITSNSSTESAHYLSQFTYNITNELQMKAGTAVISKYRKQNRVSLLIINIKTVHIDMCVSCSQKPFKTFFFGQVKQKQNNRSTYLHRLFPFGSGTFMSFK